MGVSAIVNQEAKTIANRAIAFINNQPQRIDCQKPFTSKTTGEEANRLLESWRSLFFAVPLSDRNFLRLPLRYLQDLRKIPLKLLFLSVLCASLVACDKPYG